MRTKRIVGFAAMLYLLAMASACTEEVILIFDASLKITVLDVDNKPVEGATIRITPVWEGKVLNDNGREEFTDPKGEYLLSIHEENLDSRYHKKPIELSDMEKYIQSDHEYRIKITKTGYQEVEETIVLKNGDSKQMTVRMIKK